LRRLTGSLPLVEARAAHRRYLDERYLDERYLDEARELAFFFGLLGFGAAFGKAASRARRSSFRRAVFSRMAAWLA
jgi:hypothetical protein